jgi:hypothetical protein
MIINFPFSKTFKHRCPDGTIRIIHRNVDTAFPLFIETANNKTNINLDGIKGFKGKIKNDYKTKIEGVLYELNEMNSSLMMKFRSAYILFQSNPCSSYEIFTSEIMKINSEHQNLMVLRTKIKGLIDLAGNNSIEEKSLSSGILKLIEEYKAPEKAKDEIKKNRKLMAKLMKSNGTV